MVPDECDFPASRKGRRTGANPLPVNVFFLLMPLLIGACATLPPIPEELDFSVAGRVGVVAGTGAAAGTGAVAGTGAAAGTRGGSANFLWRQYESGFDVEFWGPLGQGRTHLVADGDRLSVLTARGERIEDGQARDWIRRELRLDVPIRALSSWITGRPAPEWPASVVDADAFNQLGWQIEVVAWGDWEGRRQPRKLTASRADYRVTIVCRQWTFGAP